MLFFGNSITTDLLITIAVLVITIVFYYKWKFTYWKKRGVKTLTPSIPFGNVSDLILGRKGIGDVFQDSYNYFKQENLPYGGVYFFTNKAFLPMDMEILKCIMQKDFQHFMNHGGYRVDEEADPLTGNLFGLENEKWRNLRVKLTPTFTSSKMKMMFETVVNCTKELTKTIGHYSEEKIPMDVKEVLACFTTDVIGTCAFGIECNAQTNPNSDFRKYGKKVLGVGFRQVVKMFLPAVLPEIIIKLIKFKTTDQDVEDFFINMVKDTVNYREKHNIFRKDFMHLLIQLKNIGNVTDDGQINVEGSKEKGFTLNELAAQAFVFFIGGFETTSTTLTFSMYELALNIEVQKKLRQEIKTILKKHDNKLSYQAIMDMHYMEKVIQETLRKYPPIQMLTRICNKEYKVPGHNLTLENGTFVGIPVQSIHYDHEYYPNPIVFDPERFSEENKASRPSCTWLPFGEGPRGCLGLRFGIMQVKIGLTTLLKDFEVSINRKTKVPLDFETQSGVLTSKGGVWLDFKKIDD